MRPRRWIMAGLLATLAACDEGTEPIQAGNAVLRVSPDSVLIDMSRAVTPIVSTFSNEGEGTLHVLLCNLPAPNPPGAPLVLQEQIQNGSWVPVTPWVTCPDLQDSFDQALQPGAEVQVGRLFPANHSGRFRYQLTYSTAIGVNRTVTSSEFVVIYP